MKPESFNVLHHSCPSHIHSYRIPFVKGVWDFVYQKSAKSTAIWASKGVIIPTNFGNLEGRKKICKFYPYCVTSKKTLNPSAPCAFTLYSVTNWLVLSCAKLEGMYDLVLA